jgi:hypothetical protein
MAAEDAPLFRAQKVRFPQVNASRAQKAIADCRLSIADSWLSMDD